ncbi:MAG: SLC13 family permease [Desulfobacterales bacterium]|jgi:di/tricarboxylate transporter|nr:SLC13 family permease [Desulfobacterales bacterium]
MSVWVVSAILLLTLYLLISEQISAGLTGLGIMSLLVLFKILTPKEAVAGIANPAVITVGAMFIISKGMMRTGAVEFIGRRVIKLAKGNSTLALVVILLTIALASAFINNTPVVILFIPVVMTMCCEFGLSPSKFLIPISYASILAGTCTLIGTSTNIIISDLSAQYGYGPLGMFELSRLGVPIAIFGLIFLSFGAPRLLPSLSNPICRIQDNTHRRYLAELKIPRKSALIGQAPAQAFSKNYPDLEVLELIRYSHIYHPTRDTVEIAPDDLLLVKGSLNDLVAILHQEDVTLPRSEEGLSFNAGKDEPIVVELIISPQSQMLGQRLIETELMRNPDINIIAIKRSNLHFTERQLHDVRLKIGDIMLVWCFANKLGAIRAGKDYIMIEDVYEEIIHKRKTWISSIIFAGMITAATSGLADIMVCALLAAFLMILTGCLQMRDAYRALQGEVLLLIAGTIALGTAMAQTGTSQLYAHAFLRLLSGYSPPVILGGIILMTSISTQILSNNATAVLILPIAISAATSLGVDPKPFIVGVCFGASACFATPIGYQTNLLVYGPGGYRFSDYLKLGMPLNLMVLIAGALFIPRLWPF